PAPTSLPPLEGASAFPPEESSREAAERGRTLRLLSEHSTGNPPGSVRAVATRTPSSAPQISVRPVVDSDARTLHFPDWSEPPAPREERVEAPAATAEIAAHVAAKVVESPIADTVAAPVRANSAVRPEQAWSLVLQAT